MTRTDPRGAPRRSPTAFGEETGYDIPNSVPDTARPAAIPHQPLRPAAPFYPDVNEYLYGGMLMCRCARHAPPGAQLKEPDVYGAFARCVTCVGEGWKE